jgi:hypothetical protein
MLINELKNSLTRPNIVAGDIFLTLATAIVDLDPVSRVR